MRRIRTANAHTGISTTTLTHAHQRRIPTTSAHTGISTVLTRRRIPTTYSRNHPASTDL
ncbi:hypothetical protein SAMN04244553_2570 [Nocardia amikacinitolerans]|uniref:Uncharacterized protein n=1 Tax=Nocardia amikacinitolerans TaxID=756689 RepID=A0A285L808_9NOCA|nr:hypothetical protein SAMN04244553_2570 [Nocardia amikacinitolerans]